MTYTILKALLPKFEEKLLKFKRKFDKYGNGIITYTHSAPYKKKLTTNLQNGSSNSLYEYVDVFVEGSYQVKDYEFVASLEYMEDVGKNLIKKAPNTEDIPEKYISRTMCDHCGVNRFRKYTVLLKNTKTGKYVQVGKSCVKDYLGCDVDSFASYFAIWDTLSDYIAKLEHKNTEIAFNPFFSVQKVLEQTVATKNKYGYISKSMVEKWYENNGTDDYEERCPLVKTSTIVFYIMNKITDKYGNLEYTEFEITDEIKDEVKAIRDFITSCEQTSDYSCNLKTLNEIQYVNNENLGLVVSMVGYYIRETEKANKSAIESNSDYIGQIGEKISFTSQPECFFSASTQWGILYFYKFLYNNGKDVVIWKTSKMINCANQVNVCGTVKSHSVFNNVKQTEITRAKVASI